MNPPLPSTLDPNSALDPKPEPGPIGPIPDTMSSSSTSIRLPIAAVAGAKRPAPSLLPAFEPRSSSPSLPRAPKRRRVSPSSLDHGQEIYPTPVPTSSTGVVPSSPAPPNTRPSGNSRATSTFSERAPLSTVPSIELDRDGEITLMGRSSNSSHYQLSTNSLVSRVHIAAVYVPAKPPVPSKIHVECRGWNGAQIHCQGRIWDMKMGDTFTCTTEGVDIMVDVQDARVMVNWPQHENQITTPPDTGSPWDEDNSPRPPINAGLDQSPFQSSIRQHYRLQSPVSPSPAVQTAFLSADELLMPNIPSPAPIHVYEDEDCSEMEQPGAIVAGPTQSTQEPSPLQVNLQSSQSSALSDPDDLSEADEENDPIIHSFGPQGANLLPRMEAITTHDSDRRRPLEPIAGSAVTGSFDTIEEEITCPITNHAVNQLAYSRLASTPLSKLMDHLPSHLKSKSPGSKENGDLTLEALEKMLDATECVGKVEREGKDAAGKPLESEYYYIAELDSDETRRDAVVDGLQKPGLRNCRKQHKRYYWRKPKN